MSDLATKRIGVALFGGFSLPDVATVVEVFQTANSPGEPATGRGGRYVVHLLSPRGGRVASASSVSVWTEPAYPPSHRYSAVFVAAGTQVNTALRDAYALDWLRNIAGQADLLVPIAEGHLLLDTAGLRSTNGMPRLHALPLANPYGWRPGRFSGTVNPVQMALNLVEDDLGKEVARRIACRIELTTDTQFTPVVRRHASSAISEPIQLSARWIEANCSHPITMDEAAQIATMSGRNFLRRFKNEMGLTPSTYLLYARLDLCCRLLSGTNLPVDKVARRCGISGGGQLSKIFRKYLGTPPSEYRSRNFESMLPG